MCRKPCTQVTDRIEKKLEDLPELDFTRSVTRPGEAIVYLELLPSTKASELPRIWQTVRNMMGDIRGDFPEEFAGFQFNDNFGDVFGNIYAFTSDGFSPREVRDYVEGVRRSVQALPDAGKVEIFGTREEVIFLEFSTERLAARGSEPTGSATDAGGPERHSALGRDRCRARTGSGAGDGAVLRHRQP